MKRLARGEREATVALIVHLMEFDARQLHLAAGFSSLFVYCCEVLRLSEHETYNRIEVARTAREFPVVLELLADGALSQTTIRLLAPHLTAGNYQDLLATAARKSKRQVEELLAQRFPRPATPPSIRKLPAARPLPGQDESLLFTTLPEPESVKAAPMAQSLSARSSPPAAKRASLVTALAPDRYEIRFTASARTRDTLRLAQDLLRHAIPDGDPAKIIDRALTLLVDDLMRKKVAQTDRPRSSRGPAAGSRHVAATVRRVVWLRDDGRCAFVAKSGRRCMERGFLEFHHVDPHALGGEATVDGIQLRCRAHNAYEATLYFGRWPGLDGGVVKRARGAPPSGAGAARTRSGRGLART